MITPVRPDPPAGSARSARGAARPAQQAPVGPPPARPITIKIAAAAMCAGAILTAVGTVVTVLTIQHKSLAVYRATMMVPGKYTEAQVQAFQHASVLGNGTWGLILTALWLLTAFLTWRGLAWIRIVATALFAMNTWSAVSAVIVAGKYGFPALIAVGWVIGLVATVPLWLPASNNFLRYRPA